MGHLSQIGEREIRAKVVCIGDTTAAACAEAGLPVAAVASRPLQRRSGRSSPRRRCARNTIRRTTERIGTPTLRAVTDPPTNADLFESCPAGDSGRCQFAGAGFRLGRRQHRISLHGPKGRTSSMSRVAGTIDFVQSYGAIILGHAPPGRD